MSFLYPFFLFGLTAVSVPIIIHLFNFRRYKTVYFSNVKYLRNIKQETKSKSQLKHLLILIARILAIICLVLAFSQPFIPSDFGQKNSENEIVSIYLDNSFSMQGEGVEGKLLDIAKNNVHNIVKAYRPGTEYFFITNNLEPKHMHFVNSNQLLDFVAETEISPSTRQLDEIVSRQREFLMKKENAERFRKSVYIISDFQKTTTDFDKLKNDSAVFTYFIPVSSKKVNNLYIDSCWFETPTRKYNQPDEINVRIVNKSDEAYQNIPLKLMVNDSIKSLNSFNVDKNSQTEVKLQFVNTSKGLMNGKVEITDYPVIFDNEFFFSYSVAENIKVLSISENGNNKYFNALFQNDNYITLTNYQVSQINYSNLKDFQLIILNELKNLSSGLIQELVNFITNGGNVLLIPELEGNITSYNQLLASCKTLMFSGTDNTKKNVASLNYKAEIYKDVFTKTNENVDLPIVNKNFTLSSNPQTDKETLLASKNQDILFVSHFGKGRIYVSTISLSPACSNFATHPVFVPSIYNIALNSGYTSGLYHTIGENESIELNNTKVDDYNLLSISDLSNKYSFIPEHQMIGNLVRLYMHSNIKRAGNYLVKAKDQIISGVSFNYNRSESDLACYTNEEIKIAADKSSLKNFKLVDSKNHFLTKSIIQSGKGTPLWKLFIIFVIIFIGVEIALLRFWK